ncbi:MAG: hypothetical protein IK955_05940 [Clostridia bacterium]|nr:hypothetical protein [Clostridia bacterium]
MRRIIAGLLSLIIAVGFAIPCLAKEVVQSPVIIQTVYPTDDVVIADIVVTEAPYDADNSGKEDVTAIIQRAIDDCFANGGGTVWLPKGEYRVTGNIYIQKFVTLRGEYQDPDEGSDYGTVIIADVESSREMRPSLFTVGASAGAVGLTVWYPEQDIENVKPYPYTFYVEGNDDYMLQTIKNCTLINSYRGIGGSSQCELGVRECHEMMNIENVKGTCLYEGLNMYNSADVDTIKTLYISNRYWSNAGEKFNAPDREKLDKYTRKNGYGLVIGDLEWPNFSDVEVSDMICGIIFKPGFRYTFSGSFVDLRITDCDYGIYVSRYSVNRRGKTWGLGIANSSVEGSVYAILQEDYSSIQLTNVETKGKVKGHWDGEPIKKYMADTSSFSPDYHITYQKPNSNLYIVEADKTGKTDISAELQKKLDEAEKTGGVVYLPAGLYRLDKPVAVPAGVELRGSSSVPVRCQSGCSKGTLIISCYGYNETDKPLITLNGDGAGLNGLRIDYPLNNPVDESGDYKKTSPAVYSKYDNVYVTNCTITLATIGIELDGCKNAFLKKVIGCCIEGMFDLKNCKSSIIEACHQNANTLPRNGYSSFDLPETQNRIKEENIFNFFFIPTGRIQTTFINLKDCEDITVFNTFIYGAKSFLKTEDSTATFVNVGHDGSSKTEPALILSGGRINFLNSMRSTEDGQLGQRFYSIDNKTKFRSYNSQAVDMLFRERVVLENLKFNELLDGEIKYKIFAPIMKVFRFIGSWYMILKQG